MGGSVGGLGRLADVGCGAGAGGRGQRFGVITNWYQVKDKVSPKAYFQFVKKEEKLASSTDKQGLGAITSNLPQIAVRRSGGFQANAGVCLPATISLPCSGVCRRRPSWSRAAAR